MRVPPSLAYSAITPSFRLLTSSIKAGGQDHSRPTITPILSILPPLSSIVPADIKVNHLLPPWPIMCPAIPLAQGITNALTPQRAGEPAIVFDVWVFAADRHDNIKLA